MTFPQLLEELKTAYKNECKTNETGVVLLGDIPSPPPLAKHYLFPPMPSEILQYLVQAYTKPFPRELVEIFSVANGMDLFWEYCKLSGGIIFPFSCLSLYGYPVGKLRTQMQPYNIMLEDSTRVAGTPKDYLKFGFYREIDNMECKAEYELFVDTNTNAVCSCNRSLKEFHAEQHWSSIDECLCSLFKQLYNRTGDGSLSW